MSQEPQSQPQTDDDSQLMDYLQKQVCAECENHVNLPQLIAEKKDCSGIIVINYHNDKKENKDVIFCSRSCFDEFMSYEDLMGPIHCVVCDKHRESPKWDLKIKFEKLGGWLSIRSVCSEACQTILRTTAFKDPNCEFKMSCWYCKKLSNEQLPRCSKCKVAHYCDRVCQNKHWTEGHKSNCQSDPTATTPNTVTAPTTVSDVNAVLSDSKE